MQVLRIALHELTQGQLQPHAVNTHVELVRALLHKPAAVAFANGVLRWVNNRIMCTAAAMYVCLLSLMRKVVDVDDANCVVPSPCCANPLLVHSFFEHATRPAPEAPSAFTNSFHALPHVLRNAPGLLSGVVQKARCQTLTPTCQARAAAMPAGSWPWCTRTPRGW